jgi:hypothetical protein
VCRVELCIVYLALLRSTSASSSLWGEEDREEEVELLVSGDSDTVVFQLRNLMFTCNSRR